MPSYLFGKPVVEGYHHKFVPTPCGERYLDEYTQSVDENGVPILVKIGSKDLQAWYDSSRDSCDLSIIISQLISSGKDVHSLFNASVDIESDPVDVVDLQNSTVGERYDALNNIDENASLIAKYEAELAKLKAAQNNVNTQDNTQEVEK